MTRIGIGLLSIWLATFALTTGRETAPAERYEEVKDWPKLPAGVELGEVAGVATDVNGHVLVFHRPGRGFDLNATEKLKAPTVLEFDPQTGKLLSSWGADTFLVPHGITIDGQNNVFLTDVSLQQIFKFTHDGKLLFAVGEPRAGAWDATHFNEPTDIAIRPDGSFFVSDGYVNSRVAYFDPKGKWLYEWGRKGSGEGEFSNPHGISFIPNSTDVIVADRENSRLQLFDRQGKFKRQWTGLKDAVTTGRVFGVATDSNSAMYVGIRRADYDTQHTGVLKLDKEWNIVTAIGFGQPGDPVFNAVHDIAVSRDGSIYVAETRTKRVVKLQPQVPSASIEIAFVANAEDGTVALFDVASRSIVRTIDVNPAQRNSAGPGARNYAQDTDVSPDGRTLYVSRGYLGDVAAFDLATGRLLWERSLNTGRADHMTLTPDGKSLFVSALMDNRVYKVSTDKGEITGHVVTGVYPHDNKVSRDGRRLFNTSIGPIASLPRAAGAPPLTETPGYPFQLTIADVESGKILDRIKLDSAIRPWQFAPDEKSLYAQIANQHAVVAYDLTTQKFGKRLDLPVKPGVTNADFDFEAPHHGLALTPDGRTLCLAGRASDYAALVRAPELTLIATIPVGDAPGWAETADDGRVCLIANNRSDDLSVISIPERKEIIRLPIGNGPKHITVARIPATVVRKTP